MWLWWVYLTVVAPWMSLLSCSVVLVDISYLGGTLVVLAKLQCDCGVYISYCIMDKCDILLELVEDNSVVEHLYVGKPRLHCNHLAALS